MDEAERRVAVARPLFRGPLAHDSHGGQVVDLVELPAPLGHLVVDRIEVLRASGDLGGHVSLAKLLAQDLPGLLCLRIAIGALVGDHGLDLRVLPRMERLERKVFELPFQCMDPEPVSERRVHLECLACLLRLLRPRLVFDRAHVVEPVGELDEDDANVLRHGNDHLAVVLRLGLLAALEADPGQLRDAFDELRHLGAEFRLDLLQVRARVLDDVVEERRCDRLLVQVQLRADPGDTQRVMDELFSGPTGLARVSSFSEVERAAQEVSVDLRVVRLDLGDQLIDEVVVMSPFVENGHGFSVLSTICATFSRGGTRPRALKTRVSWARFDAGSGNDWREGLRSSCVTLSLPSQEPRTQCSSEPPAHAGRHEAASSVAAMCLHGPPCVLAPHHPSRAVDEATLCRRLYAAFGKATVSRSSRARNVSDSSSCLRRPRPSAARPSSANTLRASGVHESSPARQKPARRSRSAS